MSAEESPTRQRMTPRRVMIIAWLVLFVSLLFISNASGWTVFGAVTLGVLTGRLGWFFLQQLATPAPPPPDPGELRKVKLTFRCPTCGTEVRMTSANVEDPEPPRHCMEDMELVAPLYD